MRSLFIKGGAAALLTLAIAPVANAQFIETVLNARPAGGFTTQVDATAYSNTTNFTGLVFPNGGASGGIVRLVADDITFASGFAGQTVNGFTFSVGNLNTVAVTARPRVRFYADNAGAPGTVLNGFSFNPITFGATSVNLFTAGTPAAFVIPANGKIWAGMTFDNVGVTATTNAQLDLLGQGIFNAPTIGSSADVAFSTTTAGSFLSNNPSGNTFNFSGNPVANFGWAFTATAPVAVPEPSSIALLVGFGISGLVLRRKARR